MDFAYACSRLCAAILLAGALSVPAAEPAKYRVIVETDAFGSDPDDQASMVRFLLYSNEMDIRGIIATASPSQVKSMFDSYGRVHSTLSQHGDFPDASYLKSIVKSTGSDGVDLIINEIDRGDNRPLWYINWGVLPTGVESPVHKALVKVKNERSADAYRSFARKIHMRGCFCGYQSQEHVDAVAFSVNTFSPDRWYHRFRPLTETAGGFDINRDVKNGHGAWGAEYTTQKEGDTPAFLSLFPRGMANPLRPDWGGWGGRFSENTGNHEDRGFALDYIADAEDTWNNSTNRDNTLKRWAAHLQMDFKARMDWCVNDYAGANHHPKTVVQGDESGRILYLPASPGASVALSAEGTTDPDGDGLSYEWISYPECGTYRGSARPADAGSRETILDIPADFAEGDSVHILLIVTDDGEPSLSACRRIVFYGANIVDNSPPTTPAGLQATSAGFQLHSTGNALCVTGLEANRTHTVTLADSRGRVSRVRTTSGPGGSVLLSLPKCSLGVYVVRLQSARRECAIRTVLP